RGMLEALVKSMGPRYTPQRVSLDNYEVKHPGQAQTLDAVRAFAANLPNAVQAGRNLLLFGSPGAGKDHLMAWLMHLAIREHGIRVIWFRAADFYAKDSPISIHVSLHEGRGKPSIVAISDPVPPAGDPAPWELNKLFGLIDQRYNAMLPVWMTAN